MFIIFTHNWHNIIDSDDTTGSIWLEKVLVKRIKHRLNNSVWLFNTTDDAHESSPCTGSWDNISPTQQLVNNYVTSQIQETWYNDWFIWKMCIKILYVNNMRNLMLISFRNVRNIQMNSKIHQDICTANHQDKKLARSTNTILHYRLDHCFCLT